jgi:hypothetical protein
MASEDPSPKAPAGTRSSRWSAARLSSGKPNRLMFRLIGIPAVAFAGVLLYRGVQERLTLPGCDSSRAKQTLSDVLKQLEVAPLRDEPIKTISSGKDQVACYVVLPLADGGTLNIDYSFFWQGSTAQMKYSISRKPAQNSAVDPPRSSFRAQRSNPVS